MNDGSTDNTQNIVNEYANRHAYISSVQRNSKGEHEPGGKIVAAFNEGLATLDSEYDVICKFDADLIFPSNYLERLVESFSRNPNCGIAGGVCTIEKKGNWVVEGLTGKLHLRGALKAYRKKCFEDIGGLVTAMGWDTIDEFLALFRGWSVQVDDNLHVKHLKPTGKVYTPATKYLAGQSLYRQRFGLLLTILDSLKLAIRKRSFSFFLNSMKGYHKAKKNNMSRLVSEEEGKFIRSLRWRSIRKKLIGQN